MYDIQNIILSIVQYFFDYIWIANLAFIIIIILIERKNPLYTILWIFLLILAPYIGFFIFLFLGISFKKRRVANKIYNLKKLKSRKEIKNDYSELNRWKSLITYLEMSSQNYISIDNSIQTFFEGKDFFTELKKSIQNAKNTINMEYYIFKLDKIGKEIIDLLIEKDKEGVKINIIIDGVNSHNSKLKKYLKNTGINLSLFFKTYIPFFNLRINYRDHRKITIIDNEIAFIGGMNIGDEYLGESKIGFWRDTSVKVYGDIVYSLEKEFYFSLSIVQNKLVSNENLGKISNKALSSSIKKNRTSLQVVSCGPNYEFPVIRDNFIKLIQEAKKTILIQTPYFVPDDLLLDTLKTAIISGIDVKIMIPSKADHPFIYWVNQFYAGELLRLGANIYRYENGFIHSKTLSVDDEVISVGTCNFDYRSFYLNFEININIYNKEIATEFKNQFYRDISYSQKITLKKFKKRDIFIKVRESVFRLLSPLL